jgi:hypothetical protein
LRIKYPAQKTTQYWINKFHRIRFVHKQNYNTKKQEGKHA